MKYLSLSIIALLSLSSIIISKNLFLDNSKFKEAFANQNNSSGWFALNDSNKDDLNANYQEQQMLTPYTNWYQNAINLSGARSITEGSFDVEVGVIDTGIDNTHFLLSNLVDTYKSISYSSNDPTNPFPYNGGDSMAHGTATAGIIGASLDSSNNYVTGINTNIKLASIRADGPLNNNPYGEPLHETITGINNSIDFAESNDFEIVNYSGGFEDGQLTTSEINTLKNKINNFNGLLIVSAGNGKKNIDQTGNKVYPASLDCSNMIVVGASQQNSKAWNEDNNASYGSNYGATNVDLFAPGSNIVSTNFNNGYNSGLSGTSESAPMVTGVAALMKSVNATLTPSQLKTYILESVNVPSDHNSRIYTGCVSHGILNADEAVKRAIINCNVGSTTQSTYTMSPGRVHWFKALLSANSRYTFSGTGTNMNTSGYLYNSATEYAPLASSTPSTGHFSITFDVDKPNYFYIKMVVNSGSGYCGLSISLDHMHNYSYTPINNNYHTASCTLCSYSKQEAHTVNLITNRCIYCNKLISGGHVIDGFGDECTAFGNGSYIDENGIIFLSEDDIILLMHGKLEMPKNSPVGLEVEYD